MRCVSATKMRPAGSKQNATGFASSGSLATAVTRKPSSTRSVAAASRAPGETADSSALDARTHDRKTHSAAKPTHRKQRRELDIVTPTPRNDDRNEEATALL